MLTPVAALERFDPVPRTPFRAIPGTFQIILSGPKSAERRVHRALQSAHFVTQRTTGTEQHPTLAWVQALSHAGSRQVASEFQQERLSRAQTIGEENGYQLRQHSVVIGGPTEFRIVRDRTGYELFRIFADSPDQLLAELAKQFDIPLQDLTFQEVSGSWEVPDPRT